MSKPRSAMDALKAQIDEVANANKSATSAKQQTNTSTNKTTTSKTTSPATVQVTGSLGRYPSLNQPKTTTVNNTQPTQADLARGAIMNNRANASMPTVNTQSQSVRNMATPTLDDGATNRTATTVKAGNYASTPTTNYASTPNVASTGSTGGRTITPGTTVDLGSFDDSLFTGILDGVGFDYNYMTADQARDQAMALLGTLDLSGYDDLRNVIMQSGADNKAEVLRQYDMLVSQLAKQRTENKEEFAKTRSVISENAYDRGRQMLNMLASRGLAGSGLQQLGDIQNRMETGNQISEIANQYYDTDEEIATQGVNAQGQLGAQLASIANNMNAQLANTQNARAQYTSQYQQSLANLVNQILGNDMNKANMEMSNYYQNAGLLQDESQFSRNLAETQRQFNLGYDLDRQALSASQANQSSALAGQIEAIATLPSDQASVYEKASQIRQLDPNTYPDLQSAIAYVEKMENDVDTYTKTKATQQLATSYTGDATTDLQNLANAKNLGIVITGDDVKRISPDLYNKYITNPTFRKLFNIQTLANQPMDSGTAWQQALDSLAKSGSWGL